MSHCISDDKQWGGCVCTVPLHVWRSLRTLDSNITRRHGHYFRKAFAQAAPMKTAPKGRMPPMRMLKTGCMYQACSGICLGILFVRTGSCVGSTYCPYLPVLCLHVLPFAWAVHPCATLGRRRAVRCLNVTG